MFTLSADLTCFGSGGRVLVDLLHAEEAVKKESARLRDLIGSLKKASPAVQTRLISTLFPLWVHEHPERVAAASKYEARIRHPFDVDLGQRLGMPWTAIERLRAQARTIPSEILKEIERGNVPRAAPLLERLERELREMADAEDTPEARQALLDKARGIIAEHLSPQPLTPARRVVLGLAFTFISHDVRQRLEKMVENGAQFDAIITELPARISFTGRQVMAIGADGRREPIWEPAVFAKLIKPNRAICLFCTKESLAGLTMAVLEAGLLIDRIIRWRKPEAEAGADELIVVCGRGIPQAFGAEPDLRIITAPPLTPAERAELGTESARVPKPVAVMVPLIETFTQPGELILDPFAGAGPVGVAAIQAGRDYLGAETDPAEAARTIARLQQAHDAFCAQYAA